MLGKTGYIKSGYKLIFFIFTWKITFNSKCLSDVNILIKSDEIHLQYTFPIYVTTVEFWLFIKSQFTSDAQNALHLTF